MPAPLVAKLTRPRPQKGVVERRRLLERLDNPGGGKIRWISAQAGAGKTTLVASWLESRKIPCVWYQADEGDADIASFFSYMREAARHAAPAYKQPLPLFAPEYRLGASTFSRRFFEAMFRRVKPPFRLVIDNFQDVPAGSPFHEVLRDGLNALPDGMSAVIVSRADPPAAFARQIANGGMDVIGWKDVRFTLEESRALLELRGAAKATDDAIAAIHENADGWAAGLVLLAESAPEMCSRLERRGLPDISGISGISRERIFDYFASELLSRADAVMRDFLTTTSLLPKMSVKTAYALTDNSHAGQILSELGRDNFFIQRHATPEIVYQYHPLFREFLMARAAKRFGPEDLFWIKRMAAALLAEAGDVEDAARLLIGSGDRDALAHIILSNAESFIAGGRFMTVESWIDHLPAGMAEKNGWLLYWKAMCRLAAKPAESRSLFERAYAIFGLEKDRAGAFLSWAGIVDTFLYEWKDFKPLDRWIAEFAALQRESGGFPSPEIEEKATSAMFAALMFRQPQHPDLPRWKERVRSIMEKADDISRRMFIGFNLILFNIYTGRVKDAGDLIETLSPVIRSDMASPLPKLMWLRTVALYRFYVSQCDAGIADVEKGLKLAEESGVHLFDLMFYGVGIYHAASTGNVELAQTWLDGMTSTLGEGGCFSSIYHIGQSALVDMLRGEADMAIEKAGRCLKLAEEMGAPLTTNALHWQLVYVLLETGRFESMAPHLAAIRKRAKEMDIAHMEAVCAAFETACALHDGDDARFIDRFALTAEVCRKTGLRLVAFLPRSRMAICGKALDLGVEPEFAKELIRLHKLSPDPAMPVSDAWPWPVRIHTLGRFEILRDGEPLVFSGKSPRKPLALLKALIALGSSDVAEECLTDALWPEADGDLAHRSFETTLHRLRKLLGDDNALTLAGGRLSINPARCFVDVTALAHATALAPCNGNREKAARLYRGEFLPGETQPWAVAARARLAGIHGGIETRAMPDISG